MAKSKDACGATGHDEDGALIGTCEKTGPHLVHRDGDTKFLDIPGGVITNKR